MATQYAPRTLCSTDGQHAEASATADAIEEFLREEFGFPDPLKIDSGNGAALFYAIDEPNDIATKAVIDGCLAALAARFNTDRIKIDKTVSNAGRIARAPGTMNRKGRNIPEQPWRQCSILAKPDPVVVSRPGRPQAVVDRTGAAWQLPKNPNQRRPGPSQPTAISTATRATDGQFDVACLVGRPHGIGSQGLRSLGTVAPCSCWNAVRSIPMSTTRGEVHVQRCPDGKLLFGCKHDSCKGRRWSDLRELFEAPAIGNGERPPKTASSGPAGSRPQRPNWPGASRSAHKPPRISLPPHGSIPGSSNGCS